MPSLSDKETLAAKTFKCETKLRELEGIEWYIHNTLHQKSNFYTLGGVGAFAFDQHVYDSDLFTLLEMSGEIIPIEIDREQYYILNVLECVNALNESDCVWRYYPNGDKAHILKYSFYANRLSTSTLFKIPQTSVIEILTYAGVKAADDEFYSLYNSLGFTGLLFEELFDSSYAVVGR